MKKLIYILLCFIPLNLLLAQQTYIYTNYNLNKVIYNPALCGLNDFTEANFNIRNQWSGLEGAPQTQIFTIHGPIKNKNMGLGGNVFSDQLGAESRIGFSFSYSYNLQLNNDLNLSLGLSAGVMQYKLDNTIVNPFENNDPVFSGVGFTNIVPDATFGLYLYQDDFFLGLSVPQLLQTQFTLVDENVNLTGGLVNHYYLNGGYKFNINEQLEIEPSLLFKYTPSSKSQIDISSLFIYENKYWGGLSYRHEESVILLLGYELSDKMLIGYSYDFLISGLNTVSSGSHELKLSFRFLNSNK
tara:strand:+ start:596 stop:1492 length:897 start_codon:yes stop_codon:yes gene_type:complete